MTSNRKRINGECILSLLFLLIGIIWTINGIRLGVWSGITPAPGLFPIAVGSLLTVLSVVNFISCLKNDGDTQGSKRETRVLLFFITFALACSILIHLLGMLLTLILALMIWFKMIARYSWGKSLLVTACIMAVIYAVFVAWLRVPFPRFLELL